ncbi:MAG: hypothetical protein JNK63_10890 [Chthonomonas sp.]|nr:hypothetical protein [Chthonomonas sp.]
MVRTALYITGALLSSNALAINWVGNTKLTQLGGQLPNRGAFLEPWQRLDITTETWPIETGQSVVAVVTTNNFNTTQEYVFSWQANVGNNSRWWLQLPPFYQGAQVQFYIRAQRTGQANPVYDSQGGSNYAFLQRWAPSRRHGTILQWFQTDYRDIMRRLPEVVEAGYSAIYLPAPGKGSGGGFSSGYDPLDRFDLGDRLQKGTVRTAFGSTQELIELIRVAKRFGLEVYCDLITNHNSNRASHPINQYPDMIPEDFHIKSSSNTTNTELNFNSESVFSFGMLNHDLLGLTDIAQEDGNNTQTGTFTLPSYATFNGNGKPSFVRQPTSPKLYSGNAPVPEDSRQFIDRWVRWLAGGIGFDGFRIDAVKHTPPGYFGWAPDQAASQGFSNGNLIPNAYSAYPGLTFFGEVYSSDSYELREYAKTGMNLLDFPLFFNVKDFFDQNGTANIGDSLGNEYASSASTGLFYQQGGLSPDVGVSFIQSHDDGPPTSNNLAEAFVLGRPGRSMVYYDGNNITPGDWGHFPRPGRFDALGNGGDTVTKLVSTAARFARGYAVNRWRSGNLYVFERQLDGKGTLLVGLNDRGDNTPESAVVQTAFAPGTILRDYTGQQPDLTVAANGQVNLTVPPNYSATESNNGKGYVFYAPRSPQAVAGIEPVQVSQTDQPGGRWTPLPTQSNAMPNGIHSSARTFNSVTVTQDRVTLRLRTDAIGDSAFVKIDNGVGAAPYTPIGSSAEDLVTGFLPMSKLANGTFQLGNADISGLEDGLHLFKFRVFANTGNNPGVFTDFNQFVYVRRGLKTAISVDGNLTDLGSLVANQTRNPSSNANRIDGLYAANDDRYLIIGLPGRTDASENLTNGMVLAVDTAAGTGVSNLAALNDDSGPAARLVSNTSLTLPPNFGADYFAAIFRNSSSTSAPEAPFAGGLITPPEFGAEAALFKVDMADLRIFQSLRAAIATQVRVNKTDPAKGAEIAIPLRTIFPSGLPAGNSFKVIAWLGSTGEKNDFLLATNPLRATLGGRSAPESWISNQFIPTQSGVTNDPGTSALTLTSSQSVTLVTATVRAELTVATKAPIYDAARQVYVQEVFVGNPGFSNYVGPISLRLSLPAGVTLTNRTEMSVAYPSRPYIVQQLKSLSANSSVRFRLEYSAPSAAAITPTFEVLTGSGAL